MHDASSHTSHANLQSYGHRGPKQERCLQGVNHTIGNIEVLKRITEADEAAAAELEQEKARLTAEADRIRYRHLEAKWKSSVSAALCSATAPVQLGGLQAWPCTLGHVLRCCFAPRVRRLLRIAQVRLAFVVSTSVLASWHFDSVSVPQ